MQAGQMLAGVVHEINNPLAVILGYGQLLLERASNEEDRRDLQTILDEARRAATLVEDMLGFTRRSTEAAPTADLQRVVQSAVNLTAHEMRQARITLVATLPEHAVPVRAAHGVCLQVLLNVLGNARRSLEQVEPHRREVSVRLEHGPDEDQRVSLLVSNTGPPIEPELAEAIFEPFFTTRPDGCGLGLALCRELLAQHDATIALEPRGAEDATVTFRITLPSA
jgi:signal transduction histidine kinase